MESILWNAISKNYRDHVVTPFYDESTTLAFFTALDNLRATNRVGTRVVELGCGRGYLLHKLLLDTNGDYDSARNVIAVDFSTQMVQAARERCESDGIPVRVITSDIANLPFEDERFEEVYCVNAILSADPDKRRAMFSEAFRILEEKGVLYGLFPSNENYLEQAQAMKEELIEDGMTEYLSLEQVYRTLTSRQYDPIGGYINFEGETEHLRIKLYSAIELEGILAQTGFTNINLSKFRYPDAMSDKQGLVKGKTGIYDWIVSAKKTQCQ